VIAASEQDFGPKYRMYSDREGITKEELEDMESSPCGFVETKVTQNYGDVNKKVHV
jgi:hypothetical protein